LSRPIAGLFRRRFEFRCAHTQDRFTRRRIGLVAASKQFTLGDERALAVDEYGGITGLISMEDLLERIFGDIPSPSDAPAKPDADAGEGER